MENFLISVVIPTFNRAQVIERVLRSCTKQTYSNLEIIVVDDASADETEKIIGSLNDRRIKYLRHDKNRGPAAARNSGIRNSAGAFIAFLDSDDEWLPRKIERQIETFGRIKDKAGMVFTNGFSEREARVSIEESIPSGIYFSPHTDKFFPLRKFINPPSSWILPREVVEDIGFFDESMYNWEDGDYLVRIAYKYPIFFLNEELVIWHDSSEHLNLITPNLIKGKEIFLRKNLSFLKKDRDYLFRFYRTIGKDASKIDKKRARHYFLNALKLKPFDFSLIGKVLQTF